MLVSGGLNEYLVGPKISNRDKDIFYSARGVKYRRNIGDFFSAMMALGPGWKDMEYIAQG